MNKLITGPAAKLLNPNWVMGNLISYARQCSATMYYIRIYNGAKSNCNGIFSKRLLIL